jgi:4-hydroxythreonine-4-phosphate dehydrogenase
MGDPAGIGPEVVVRALSSPDVHQQCRPLVVGDAGVMVRAVELVKKPLSVRPIADPAAADFRPRAINVVDLANVKWDALERGRVSAAAGLAALEYVNHAVQLAMEGSAAAVVTGPINKESIRAAGCKHIGHTELFHELTGASATTTMLVAGNLRVAHVTRHVPLHQVSPSITMAGVLQTISLTDEGLRRLGFAAPRLAVAALNPHGGDGGLIGTEESLVIEPAVRQAQALGVDADGPLPADSVFFRAIRGEFDAVIAMYHDQGHIAIKVHDFDGSYTVTLGLPLLRTSVDHGTAFDIAWKGLASGRSMIEAILAAARFARI